MLMCGSPLYLLQQAGVAATMDIKTTLYLKNGWRYFNQNWYLKDVGHYSTSHVTRNAASNEVQYGDDHHLKFLVSSPIRRKKISRYILHAAQRQITSALNSATYLTWIARQWITRHSSWVVQCYLIFNKCTEVIYQEPSWLSGPSLPWAFK